MLEPKWYLDEEGPRECRSYIWREKEEERGKVVLWFSKMDDGRWRDAMWRRSHQNKNKSKRYSKYFTKNTKESEQGLNPLKRWKVLSTAEVFLLIL